MRITLLAVAVCLFFCTELSAQTVSKMEINVKVRSGATISFEDHFDVEYSGFANNAPSVFTSHNEIEFLAHPNLEVIVNQQSIAELQNEFGEHMMIQSTVKDMGKELNGLYSLSVQSAIDFEKTPRGTYKGNYSTSIEYL